MKDERKREEFYITDKPDWLLETENRIYRFRKNVIIGAVVGSIVSILIVLFLIGWMIGGLL